MAWCPDLCVLKNQKFAASGGQGLGRSPTHADPTSQSGKRDQGRPRSFAFGSHFQSFLGPGLITGADDGTISFGRESQPNFRGPATGLLAYYKPAVDPGPFFFISLWMTAVQLRVLLILVRGLGPW